MKNKIAILLAFSLLISAFVFGGCGSEKATETESNGKPVIAVSIIPEEAFVKAVAGDLCEVVTMIPPGASPTNYEPSPQEMMEFSKADIYFSIGVPSETAHIIPGISEDTKLVSLAEASLEKYPERKIGEGRDPHIWLSPKRAAVMVDKISEELSLLDPENADEYESRVETFKAELSEADEQIKASLENVKNPKMIVFHPAFGYLADDYGLTMYALEKDGKEATADHLAEMIDFAKAEGIKVIFYQAEVDSRQSQAFAEEIGGKAAMLSPLSGDYIENLKLMAETIAEAMN